MGTWGEHGEGEQLRLMSRSNCPIALGDFGSVCSMTVHLCALYLVHHQGWAFGQNLFNLSHKIAAVPSSLADKA